MALLGQEKVNGKAETYQAIGREIAIVRFTAASAITQEMLDALVEEVQAQNVTINAIGALDLVSDLDVVFLVDGHSTITAAGYTVTVEAL